MSVRQRAVYESGEMFCISQEGLLWGKCVKQETAGGKIQKCPCNIALRFNGKF